MTPTLTLCRTCHKAIADDGGPGIWAHAERLSPPYHPAEPAPAWLDSREVADIVLRSELSSLWDDLRHARRFAYNQDSHWSMGCEGLAGRILVITRLVGPIGWMDVPYPFLLSLGSYTDWGYRETAAKIGVEADLPDPEQERTLRAFFEESRAAL